MLTFTIGDKKLKDMTPAEFEDICKLCNIEMSKIERRDDSPLREGEQHMHPTLKVIGSFGGRLESISFEVKGDAENSDKDSYGDYAPLEFSIEMGEFWYENSHGRIEPLKNYAEIILAKQRSGPVGMCKVFFQKKYLLFQDLGAPEYPWKTPQDAEPPGKRN